MKTKAFYLLILIMGYLNLGHLSAQVTGLGNGYNPGWFVGWDATNGVNPLEFRTNNLFRMQINGNRPITAAYLGSGPGYFANMTVLYPGLMPNNVNGFMGLGFQGIPTPSPRSLFHIQGPLGAGLGTGWRPWMRTGTYTSENSNGMYVGMYALPNGSPQTTDAVVNWSDDAGANSNQLRINFTASNFFISPGSNIYDIDREMASFWTNRRVGIGDFINFTNGPQRQLHLHDAFNNSNLMQFTNTSTIGGNTPPVQSGFHIGVANATANLIQFENTHMLFYTNIVAGAFGERMRITHIGAPGLFPVVGVGANTTRIGISYNPATPVTNPKSLLHLGYNAGVADGWRPWMEQGVFNTRTTDHVYIGIKPEASIFGDRNDAVIGWGDNGGPYSPFGPENLRFIFSVVQTIPGIGGNGQTGYNGQEAGRFTANCIGCPLDKPSFGIGDFAPSGPQGPGTAGYIEATLDVDGDANIRSVQNNNTLNQVLVRDPLDKGKVYWRDANTITPGGLGVSADNALRMSTPVNVQWGQVAGSLPPNSSQLIFDTEIPMNNFNIAFSKVVASQDFRDNNVVIGTTNATVVPNARLEVIKDLSIADPANVNPIGLRVENNDLNTGVGGAGDAYGIYSKMFADNKGNIGGYFWGTSTNISSNGIDIGNIGLKAHADGGFSNRGVYGSSFGPAGSLFNMGGYFQGDGPTTADNYGIKAEGVNGAIAYGGWFSAYGGTVNRAVYAEALVAPNSDALYVNGNATLVTGTATGFGSDSTMKTNFISINNATTLLNQLNPYTFNYRVNDFPTLNLDNDLHYGLVAQNVETVIPELVGTFNTPEETDSLGNIIIVSQTLKTVKYTEIIPILIAGFNEQQERIDEQDSTIAAMQQQMEDMMAMITNCCSQGNNLQAPNNNGNNTNYVPNTHQTDVRLSDSYCVLGENSPNPFRDHTVINYNLAESIQSAQIVFYNTLGQVIKVVEVDQRGEGRLNVYGEDLRSGMYTYSLIIDGNVCETKKMIKE